MKDESEPNDLSIFPPVNHEDLPIPLPPPPPHAPLTLHSDDHPSSPSPQQPPPQPPKHNSSNKKNYSQLIKLFDFALHFLNSKLLSFLTNLPLLGFFSSLRVVGFTASFVVWYWFRKRRRKHLSYGCGEDSIEDLKAIVQSKDEKILQLLEQIAQMNKVLLARFKITAL